MQRMFVMALALLLAGPVMAQEKFSTLVGPTEVRPVQNAKRLPYITWGGDVATFLANGGLKTRENSVYGRLGLNFELVKGDDFVGQVRDYMSGKSPFLRGTPDMLGQASEVIGSDPRTKPVIFLQLTWSAGDHVVVRDYIHNINELVSKGRKRIAVQQGGPHVGLVYAMLTAAQAKREAVEIVWTKDLTGPNGPAEAFRKDPTLDAACVITPDMIGLTGGLEAKGSGAEGTIKGAHIVVSTQQMSRAIPDVYACRSDWYEKNHEFVDKFVAGYLKGCDDLVKLRKEFSTTTKLTGDYRNILQVAQTAFGKDVIPTLEVDGHSLLLDAVFVGLPGQISFFNDKGNLNGYDAKAKVAIDLATSWGYASNRMGFVPAQLDYEAIATLAGIKYEAPKITQRVTAESVNLFPDSNLDDRTLLTFTINFDPNQNEFSADQYGAEFQRALQAASMFGNAVVAVRGHSDPTKTLVDLIKAGTAKDVIKRTGQQGAYQYFFGGKELDLSQTEALTKLIAGGSFDGVNPSPRETMQAALNLSLSRAESVKASIVKYAESKKINLDKSQIQPVGIGILEPVVPKPKNITEAKKNMRVEFRITRVPAEAIKSSDFDY